MSASPRSLSPISNRSTQTTYNPVRKINHHPGATPTTNTTNLNSITTTTIRRAILMTCTIKSTDRPKPKVGMVSTGRQKQGRGSSQENSSRGRIG